MDNRSNYRFVNGYTRDKLFVAVISALRSYNELGYDENNRISLERIIESSVSIYKERKYEEFDWNLLKQLKTILCLNNEKLEENTSGFTAIKEDGIYVITSCFGKYYKYKKLYLDDMMDKAVLSKIAEAEKTRQKQYDYHSFAVHFEDSFGDEHVMYITLPRAITEWDRNLIDIFCGGVVSTYDLLHRESIRDTSLNEIIYALGEVAEARTRVIGNHVERVAAYVGFICEMMGMDDVEAGLVTNASTVHDIGKLLISDKILNKPARLTDEEFELVKTHASIGQEILTSSNEPLLMEAAIIAGTHHERYDGSGYPAGLIGEAIPLSGRIVAIADVVDALSSDTVYKKAWEMDRIAKLLEEESGKHFDPKIVRVFLDNLDRFLDLKDLITLT